MPTQDLNVTIIQADLQWEDATANFDRLGRLIEGELEPSDLIVLPETFSTGFSMNTGKAETMGGAAMQWMTEVASVTGAVVTGSLVMEEGGKHYNRLIWMRPDGTYEQYDKRHLFGMGKENEYFTAGNKRLITELNGWNICPSICYDLRFPVWLRNKGDYDLQIFVANWPAKRSYAWQQLLVARAIENQAYVVGVNRVGHDGLAIPYTGDSRVVDPMGAVVFELADGEFTKTITLSAALLNETREQLPFLKDADGFELKWWLDLFTPFRIPVLDFGDGVILLR